MTTATATAAPEDLWSILAACLNRGWEVRLLDSSVAIIVRDRWYVRLGTPETALRKAYAEALDATSAA
jgi:hypothetical protein